MTLEAVFVKARDTALRYVGSRARTIREIVRRLEADDYPADIIEKVIAVLKEYRYADDRQYARDYAESRLRAGRYGLVRVKRELTQKGVPETYIEEALRRAGRVYGEVRAAREWLERKQPDLEDPPQRKRCAEALVRRGFSYGAVKEALAAYQGAGTDE